MKQYLELCQRIVDEGQWVENKRTGTRCLTVINADLEYDVANNQFPMITTRKSYYKAAIAELLGYLRGYDSAAQFREIGCKTWDANANDNNAWLNNPNRNGIDDRGEIITFYNPGEFELGCLRPCMHTHTFSLLGDTLYLTSYQRSCDVPLLLPYNRNAQYENEELKDSFFLYYSKRNSIH